MWKWILLIAVTFVCVRFPLLALAVFAILVAVVHLSKEGA